VGPQGLGGSGGDATSTADDGVEGVVAETLLIEA
jgi:hypothetical protein